MQMATVKADRNNRHLSEMVWDSKESHWRFSFLLAFVNTLRQVFPVDQKSYTIVELFL